MTQQSPIIEERWDTAAGLRLFSRVSIEPPRHADPPVVLLHGLSVSSRPFLPSLRALAPVYPTHALDLPGFGHSAGPPRILDIVALADAAAAWMRVRGLTGAVVVGHSMGAQVVVELALRHSELVRGVVLVSPTGDPRARSVGRQLARLARDGLREPPKLTALVLRDYLRAGIRRSLATLRAMHAHPMAQRLTELACPTLLVAGDRDPVVPRAWAADVVDRLPNGRNAIVPDGTHGVQFGEPDALAAAIRAFIQSAVVR